MSMRFDWILKNAIAIARVSRILSDSADSTKCKPDQIGLIFKDAVRTSIILQMNEILLEI